MTETTAPETALQQLEFQRALECVAEFAVSDLGAESIRARRPGVDIELIERELDEVAELASLLRDDGGFRSVRVDDIRDILDHVTLDGSVLSGEELITISATLESIQALHQQLSKIEYEAAFVGAYIVEPPPPSVGNSIERALERDGSVKDSASAELARARREMRNSRKRLVSLMEKTLKGLEGPDRPADAAVTVREGRYVLPVIREAKSRVKGIVHGESGSGATLFIEPAGAVELGNDLREWGARETRAILEVFRNLTESVRQHADEIRAGWTMCVRVDDLYARAAYSVACSGSKPSIGPAPSLLDFRKARHPVLLAEGVNVVPFSLEMRENHRVLVVSGPNAGGKTVLLKTTGLVCMMVQAGVIPPLGKGSHVPVFDQFFTDIGDRQSIAESLSTYSAHLKALKGIVEKAGGSALVLIDEFGTGTDPAEGAALAGAILLELVRKNSCGVVTTHLNPLKELASSSESMFNASLRFDEELMRSSYELLLDVPGRSYGLTMARQLGMPEAIVAEAETLMPKADRDIEALLADLGLRDAKLAELQEQVTTQSAELKKRHAELTARESEFRGRNDALQLREREVETEGREKARKYLLEARNKVEEALAEARLPVEQVDVRKARQIVEKGVREEADSIQELTRQMEARGWRVKGPASQKGGGKESGGVATKSGKLKLDSNTPPQRAAGHDYGVDAKQEISLRGLREADAEWEVIQALDSAIAADLSELRIIHGKGTGALRAMVQRVLKNDRRVAKFDFAPLTQGGPGVTVAEFNK